MFAPNPNPALLVHIGQYDFPIVGWMFASSRSDSAEALVVSDRLDLVTVSSLRKAIDAGSVDESFLAAHLRDGF